MSFPQDILDLQVELNLAGTWTDITGDVRGEQSIRITRGRADEASQIEPSRCSLTLDNRDGRYSPRNPMSPYYGSLGRNTPLRVSVHAGDAYLNLPGAVGDRIATPDAAALDITGDIDVRIDFELAAWATGETIEVIGKYDPAGNQRSWRIAGNAAGGVNFTWSTDGTVLTEYVGAVVLPLLPSGRKALRATLDVDNGASGYTLTYYTADTMAGPWVQLEQAITTSGPTNIFNSTAPLEIGDISTLGFVPMQGRVLAAEVRNGINGTVVADPDFTTQAVGASSFTDSAGRVWTVAGAASLSNRRTRFSGEVSEWPPRWQPGGFDVTASIEAAGILRRLRQGSAPLKSTLRRRIPSDPDLLAYWPMEDQARATQAASPIEGVRPMIVSGDVTFGAESSLPGSEALPTLATGASVSGRVPSSSGAGWHVELVYRLDGALPAAMTTFFQVQLSGSVISKALVRVSSSAIRIELRDDDGVDIAHFDNTDAGALADFTGDWARLQIYAVDSGSTVDVFAWWIAINTDDNWFAQTTITGNPGNVYAVTTGTVASDFDGVSLGHIAVFDISLTGIFEGADTGFTGENAIARIARVCDEESIVRWITHGDITRDAELVGPQRPAAVMDVIQSAADADGGILYERRELPHLAYRDRAGLETQTVWLAADYTDVAHPLEPVDDDQTIRNDVIVTREGGSSGRAVLESGPLSIKAPPDGVGTYDQSITLNLANDDQPAQHANWLMHLGTWDEARYPVVRVNLARNPELVSEVSRVDVGDRIQIGDPPGWLPPDTIDLLVQGYTETLSQFQWSVEFNCTPAGPWNVASADEAVADTEGCELAGSLTATAVSVPVTTTAGPRWVDSIGFPGDFPFDIRVGGEVMTVTACVGTTATQTFTVIRSVNGVVKSHSSGSPVALAAPAYAPL